MSDVVMCQQSGVSSKPAHTELWQHRLKGFGDPTSTPVTVVQIGEGDVMLKEIHDLVHLSDAALCIKPLGDDDTVATDPCPDCSAYANYLIS